MTKLALFWPLDADGYDLDNEGRIREKRQRRPIFRNVFKIDSLIRRLAEMDGKTRPANAKGALDFVETYGFLSSSHGPESFEVIAMSIRSARSLLRIIDRKDWPLLQEWALQNASKIHMKPSFQYFEDEDISELFFGPKRFIDAIYLQALDDVAAGTQFERCDNPGCPEYFRVGPGSGRSRVKRDHRFCSPKCQKQFAYRLRKGEIK